MVREWGEEEVVGLEGLPSQGVGAHRVQVSFQHPAYEVFGEALSVEILEQPSDGIDQCGPDDLLGADAVEHECAALGELEDLCQKLGEMVDADALCPERLDEGVMLFLRLRHPDDPVEEHLADVLW